MQAHELFQTVKPFIVQDIFMWMRDTDRNLYKTALGSLATNRKLRLPYLQKKPVTEQIEWIRKTLELKSSDMIGEHLLQVYQPPFSPIRSGPKAASKPFRQKQIPSSTIRTLTHFVEARRQSAVAVL